MSALRILPFALALLLPALAQAQSPIKPGLWEVTTMPHDIVMPPGVPPQVAAMAKGKAETVRKCISAEQAAQGSQALLEPGSQCRYTRYDASGDQVDAEAVCTASNGNREVSLHADFDDAGFTMEGSMTVPGPNRMSMKFSGQGKLLGDCD